MLSGRDRKIKEELRKRYFSPDISGMMKRRRNGWAKNKYPKHFELIDGNVRDGSVLCWKFDLDRFCVEVNCTARCQFACAVRTLS
jgi:hypothetical protein